MTSRNCTKSYSRKVCNNVTSCSIQFDRQFKENSNRPSAAKSAGTVGKWGTTSFTSIRSTNIIGKNSDDACNTRGTKRIKSDCEEDFCDADPLSFLKNEKPETDVDKPKKFFKSRNKLSTIEESRFETDHKSTPNSQITQYRHSSEKLTESIPNNKEGRDNVDLIMDNLSRDEFKPPIVLRICKGTSRLVSSDEDIGTLEVPTINTVERVDIDQKTFSLIPDSGNQSRSISLQTSLMLPPITDTSHESDMRTTRSRAKTLQPDDSRTALLTDTQNTALSLTLRKSIVASKKTPVSHYDIVKANCSLDLSDINKSSPSSAQEFMNLLSPIVDSPKDILSDDNIHVKSVLKEPSINILRKIDIHEADLPALGINSSENESHDPRDIPEKFIHVADKEQNHNFEHIPKHTNENDLLFIKRSNKTIMIDNLDHEWSSSSDDSGNAHGTIPLETQRHDLSLKPSAMPIDIVVQPSLIKKGSIFKTRSTGAIDGNKRRALYKHKWSDNDRELLAIDIATNEPGICCVKNTHPTVTTSDQNSGSPSSLRTQTYPESGIDLSDDMENTITSIRCGKKIKEFYTVVKNVKKAHQIQESGEFQEFNDDVEYILDTLRENNPNATRCLSAIRLASKCMAPAFRMHVRAHGTVTKFFRALHDATTDQSLALCTATVMFVLSQDRLAMDLDRDCLELMLSLLESDASHMNALDACGLSHAELMKNKEKVRQLCADIQSQGHAKHLNLDNITVGHLAMETLLSLTSRRAGEWFKEELRELGGLEHIIKTVADCYHYINSNDVSNIEWDQFLLDKLRKVDRCLRVLENVTHMNEGNQTYLIQYDQGIIISTLSGLYDICGQEIPKYRTDNIGEENSVGVVIRECLFAVIKVLINLTHRFNKQTSDGGELGCQSEIIKHSFYLIPKIPSYLPEGKRFDMMMLTLILLINLTEQNEENKKSLATSKILSVDGKSSGLDALIELFYEQEELARVEEQKTDAILDGKKDSESSDTVSTTSKSQEEFIEETVTKLLQKAGRHMEHTLIGAYVVLLLGYIMMNNKEYENVVKDKLPNGSFSAMISVLQKFFNFMNLTASNDISSCGIAATEKIIKFLQLSDVGIENDVTDFRLASKNNLKAMNHRLI